LVAAARKLWKRAITAGPSFSPDKLLGDDSARHGVACDAAQVAYARGLKRVQRLREELGIMTAATREVPAGGPKGEGQAPTPPDPKPSLGTRRKKKPMSRGDADLAMRKALETVPERGLAWTIREWAEHLGCSTSTVHRTETWEVCERAREKRKQERQERDE